MFFAVSGAWQLFALHRGLKDGSYSPPRALVILSDVHQFQHVPPTSSESGTPLRYFIFMAAVGLMLTTVLGIIMAFRFSPSKASVILCLLAGVVIPAALLLIYH